VGTTRRYKAMDADAGGTFRQRAIRRPGPKATAKPPRNPSTVIAGGRTRRTADRCRSPVSNFLGPTNTPRPQAAKKGPTCQCPGHRDLTVLVVAVTAKCPRLPDPSAGTIRHPMHFLSNPKPAGKRGVSPASR
jgi:hypothetical protein